MPFKRSRGEDDNDLRLLEAELQRLANATAYPPAPPLAAAVRRRLEAGAPLPPPRWRLAPAPGLAAALAVLVVAFALTLALSVPARDAVADFFGLGNVRIFQTEEPPATLPREVQGTPSTLAQAQQFLGRPVRLPAGIAAPDRVLLQEFDGFQAVVLEYRSADPPFLLFATTGFLGKGISYGESYEVVQELGEGAVWLKGLHILEYYDDSGNVIQESRRAAANTLIWSLDGLTYRLEGDFSLDDALDIARSLR